MMHDYIYPDHEVVRDYDKCIACRACERQCANNVHVHKLVSARTGHPLPASITDEETVGKMTVINENCVNCHRCVAICPTHALKIVRSGDAFKHNANWQRWIINEAIRQAGSGAVLLSSMGTPEPYPVYWDKILINASQVTNPSIDPLREPMEVRTRLGAIPADKPTRDEQGRLKTTLPPGLNLSVPILFSAMSYGSISYNAHASLARAAEQLGIYYNTGEGGLHTDFVPYHKNTIVQVASGRFGVHQGYLDLGAAIEIKMGQGAKPGIGGHLPGKKIVEDISRTRMIPEGTDAISPAPHHDIYSIEDLRQLVFSLKEATRYKKPVIVKIAAVHNIAAIASGIARSGADIIAIDGFRGGTGAAPTRIRNSVGIPIELALAAVDSRLRDEGIRHQVSLIAGGSIRNSADVVKAVALGADAVYIATGALLALGCHLCRTCHTGKCNWGIATQSPELVKRLNPEIGAARLVNLVTAWEREIKEMMGGMGINAIEALRGNRAMLRGVGLTDRELGILGIKHAGESM
ncbi:MAG: alpha-hydroxy-acid oxidizing protein [Oscillospiraceae bacterium]|jgi:glutamate synthase domain-containing protein 2|nr:alpha-hydroxy-acid oxidizing protein [Oscillospiraceae bacterium]